MSVYSTTVWWLWVCNISVCLMPKFEMSVCRVSVINVFLGNDCVALISFLWCDLLSWMPVCGISVCWMAEFSFCPTTGCFTMRCHCLRWLCGRCICYGCMSEVYVLYVCVYNVCRIYILDVFVFDDCVAVVGVRHLFAFNAQIWNVCLQNVWDLLCSMPLCGISVCWMA